jgi:hypothetical protein
MALPELEVLEPQGGYLGPSQAAADQNREQGTVASVAEGVSLFCPQQPFAFFCG